MKTIYTLKNGNNHHIVELHHDDGILDYAVGDNIEGVDSDLLLSWLYEMSATIGSSLEVGCYIDVDGVEHSTHVENLTDFMEPDDVLKSTVKLTVVNIEE